MRAAITVIADKIRSEIPPADISDVMGDVETLLDQSVAAEGYVIHEPAAPFDLSKIDFDALKKCFRQGYKHTEAARLRGAISSQLRQLIRLNRSRMDYQETFQQMIDEWNEGRAGVDLFFEQLIAFARELDVEEQRHIAEQLTEEELAVFDLLTRPEVELSKAEVKAVKQVARELLETLKQEKLVLDWRKRQQARAAVQLTIAEMLDRLPAQFSTDMYQQKCELIYQHIYDSYYGAGRSIYAAAA